MQEIFGRHPRATLFFSAGKDSLACLLLLRDYWDRLDVVWANPGAPYPQVLEYMQKISALVPHFIQLHGDQPGWIAAHGWPADVVPVRSTVAGEAGAGASSIRVQPYFSCCSHNMWQPMQRHLDTSQPTLVIMGQRREESLRNRMRDERLQTLAGVEYFHPVNDWTSAQVIGYIQSQGMALPPFYSQGFESSADCWSCTAYLDHNKTRLQRMRQDDPDRWSVIHPVLLQMQASIHQQTAPLDALLTHPEE